ncbi:MAG: bifunctional riboflavin kinase/FAD synthetase [Fimbriimonadaceae bacterium]
MRTHYGFASIPDGFPSSIVCLGAFDGVHRGHREVLRVAVEEARSLSLPAVALTFDRHPAATLAPDREPLALCSLEEKVARILATGIDIVVVAPFDREMASTTADDFYRSILIGQLHAEAVVVGHDFGFGKGREGSPQWLSQRMRTIMVPPFEWRESRVSSTRIRDAISVGDVAAAGDLLGQPHTMEGVVVAGQKLGRTLGYPTANLVADRAFAVPPDGIYVVDVQMPDKQVFRGALSIGNRPTVGGTSRTIEVFLIGYKSDSLYGQVLAIKFLDRIRDELHFDSLDALKERMAMDVRIAEEYP